VATDSAHDCVVSSHAVNTDGGPKIWCRVEDEKRAPASEISLNKLLGNQVGFMIGRRELIGIAMLPEIRDESNKEVAADEDSATVDNK
jgi:hypothetical protein